MVREPESPVSVLWTLKRMARWCQRCLSKVRRVEGSNIPVGHPHLFLKSPCSQASVLHPPGLTPPLPLSISTSCVQHLWTSPPSPGPLALTFATANAALTYPKPSGLQQQAAPSTWPSESESSLLSHLLPLPPSPPHPDLSTLCSSASILLQAITSLPDYQNHLPTGLPAASLTSLPLPCPCHTTLCQLLLLPPSLGQSYALHLKFIHLFWAVLGLHCCMGFSLVASSVGYSLVVTCGLLIAVVFLVVECGL